MIQRDLFYSEGGGLVFFYGHGIYGGIQSISRGCFCLFYIIFSRIDFNSTGISAAVCDECPRPDAARLVFIDSIFCPFQAVAGIVFGQRGRSGTFPEGRITRGMELIGPAA